MKAGDLVITPIPQADGLLKNRPAVLLREMPRYHDWLVCGVSTQLHQYIDGFDEIITPSDPDFILSGLATQSIIRLGFLAVLPSKSILGTIGSVSGERHQRLLNTLSDYLLKSSQP